MLAARSRHVGVDDLCTVGGGGGGGGKVWLGLPDAQRTFYAHAGTQTHARTGPFKTFQGIPVEILPPSGQKRKKAAHSTVKK